MCSDAQPVDQSRKDGPPSRDGDPLVDDVRAAREALDREFGEDLVRRSAALRELQRGWTGGVISESESSNRRAG